MLLINQQRFAYCAALFLLVLSSIYTIPNSYAGSIDDLIIDLEVGQWDRKQTTFVNGKGVPQLSFVGANCRSEQEPDLTLRDYTNKVIRNLGSETDCDVSNLVDTKTKVSFDMRCTASDTQLVTLLDVNYRISRERMRLKAQGSIEHKNGSTPIKVTAESRWLGPCNDAIPEMEDQRLIGANQPYNLQNAIDANSSVASSIATKKRVKSIKPSRLSIYLKSRKSNKPLVVHYSSTDPNCTHCIKDNKSIEQAYETLEEKFDFVQVVFNPWQSFTKKYRRLGGLPTTEIFDGVVPESMIKGFQADMASNITHVHKETQELLADDYDEKMLMLVHFALRATLFFGQRHVNSLINMILLKLNMIN